MSSWKFGVVTGRDAIVRMGKGNGVFDRIREDEREFRITGRVGRGVRGNASLEKGKSGRKGWWRIVIGGESGRGNK